jgi:hypothetical protein
LVWVCVARSDHTDDRVLDAVEEHISADDRRVAEIERETAIRKRYRSS